jgi:hypothetical protein
MTAEKLLAAIRVSSRSPLAERSGPDLGRFELCMKAVSFSHCRRLIVFLSRAGKEVS